MINSYVGMIIIVFTIHVIKRIVTLLWIQLYTPKPHRYNNNRLLQIQINTIYWKLVADAVLSTHTICIPEKCTHERSYSFKD